MSENREDARELVLAPNEYAYILDKTKGDINVYVGPKKDSLAQTDQPVFFSYKSKRFERCDIAAAAQKTVIAPEGWYVTLKNPAKENKHPASGNRSSVVEMETGRKINIPGPCSFALWPGQMFKLIPGHTLRSNQYLLVRVYDETAARLNWGNTIIKTTSGSADGPSGVQADKLSMGQLVVIRGTDVSFFIPPTGIEVVADQNAKLVRDAVTLERLDYCLLLDEDGNKRYVQGPAVVFPDPTEVFVAREVDGAETRKFRGIELSETSGIYIKVIADYRDPQTGKDYKAGDELFITGNETRIYFPREEHAVIKYGDHEVHYATAIPAGEGRYVLDRITGDVRLVRGPSMCLPDPRREVFARRILDLKLCTLLYPDNREALAHNQALLRVAAAEEAEGAAPLAARAFAPAGAAPAPQAAPAEAMVSNAAQDRGLAQVAAKGFTGDGFERKARYTEPRSVTLNTKYQGVVSSDLWTGYAIKLVKRSGDARVEVGPKTVMFEYDEVPQILKLSTGKPKNADNLFRTVFLQVYANKVSDIIDVESLDFCRMQLKLSYRVNFVGDPKLWFSIENYVKFLCDHMRSRLHAAVKRFGVEEFYQNAVDAIRDVVLGRKDGEQPRSGTTFRENGMQVYDVEVLDVTLLDPTVEQYLVQSQREAIQQRLELATQRRTLSFTREKEEITRQIELAKAETRFAALTLGQQEIGKQLAHDLAQIQAQVASGVERHKLNLANENAMSAIGELELERERQAAEQVIALDKKRADLRLEELAAEVEALVKRAQAISPDLVAAIGAFGERSLIEKLAESMSPLAILGGSSVTEVVKKLLEGTKLAQYVQVPTNGQSTKPSPAPLPPAP